GSTHLAGTGAAAAPRAFTGSRFGREQRPRGGTSVGAPPADCMAECHGRGPQRPLAGHPEGASDPLRPSDLLRSHSPPAGPPVVGVRHSPLLLVSRGRGGLGRLSAARCRTVVVAGARH